MTFPHHRSTPATSTAGTQRRPRAWGVVVIAALALALALASCGVDAGQDAVATGDSSSASTTAAPTTAATTTTTEDDGVGGVGGTNGDKGDSTDTTDEPDTTTTEATGSGGTGDSTGQLTVDEISQEFQSAGLPKEQADCIAEIVHDADLTKDELDEFTRSEDGDTAAGKVLTDAMGECFGFGE